MASASFQLAGPLLGHTLDHDFEAAGVGWGVGAHFMTISSHSAGNVLSQV